MKTFRFVPLILLIAIAFAGCFSVKPPDTPKDGPDSPVPTDPTEPTEFDGLPQAVFDTTVRIRNNDGMGSGSIVADLGDAYEFETNHHVAGREGSRAVIDLWVGGDLVASKPTQTVESWFEASKSKDIAVLRIPKSELGGPLSVVETAPAGFSETIKPGDKIFTIGCSNGRWPRARCGNVLEVTNGLIWYDPESIPGDSGSGVYKFDPVTQKWYCIGRTAWAIQRNGKWVGLAMTSDRVRAIREGRVSEGWDLPAGAKPIELVDFGDPQTALPNTAIRLDLMQTQEPSSSRDDPQPIETCIREWKLPDPNLDRDGVLQRLLNRHSEMIDTRIRSEAAPIREGIGAAVRWIGIAIAGSTVFILVTGWLYLRAKLP